MGFSQLKCFFFFKINASKIDVFISLKMHEVAISIYFNTLLCDCIKVRDIAISNVVLIRSADSPCIIIVIALSNLAFNMLEHYSFRLLTLLKSESTIHSVHLSNYIIFTNYNFSLSTSVTTVSLYMR